MTGAAIRWLVVALAGFVSTEAVARRSRASSPAPRGATAFSPSAFPRPPNTAPRPPGDGIIHWNTPNKDGNLGGPGTGGGGGGGG
ncbi:hypothetical protein SAMN02799625_01914 [Methylobacterium sp. UNC300MFChir4.1]|nr:hypothetical protein SAMN02799625_01914 [Methylobacterium sp. UNC300MFChir4.1]